MIFCGQCGLQLAPGDTVCPRCGTVVETDLPADDPHSYDPTIAISKPPVPPQTPPTVTQQASYTPPQTPAQQKLVLRPGRSDPGFGTPSDNDPTSMMTRPASEPAGRSYPDYVPQSGNNYPQQPYPVYPVAEPASYPQTPAQYSTPQPPMPRRRGRGLTLVVILLLLLVLGAAAAYVTKPGLFKGLLGQNTAVTQTTVATPSPADEARNLIQQYYADINKQDYRDAYNMWGSDFQKNQSYTDFAKGYSHTRHDDVTIDSLTTNPDGTVKAAITIVAQEDSNGGIVTSTYKGTYNTGLENGAWKFLSGTFTKV